MSPVKYVHIGEGELRVETSTYYVSDSVATFETAYIIAVAQSFFYFPFSPCEGHLSVRSYTVATGTEVDRSKKRHVKT